MTTAAHALRAPLRGNVVIASSNPARRQRWVESLHRAAWPAQEASGGADALGKLESSGGCRLLLLDQKLADLNTDELVGIVEARFPATDVVLLDSETGRPRLPSELMSSPLYRLLASFDDTSGVESASSTEADERPARVATESSAGDCEPLAGMVGSSPLMRRLYRMVRLVAPRQTTVLVIGESGTGKELVAQALHQLSPRARRPFVTVNCAAIPETLLEAELFGYTRGAFTGAVQAHAGKVHSAQGGTLFLDEIGEMPHAVQAKVLRFLESHEVQRLGSCETFRADVRVVAATNARLRDKVAARQFREDLYYRLAVFPVETPALREHPEDLQELARFFLAQFRDEPPRISRAAEELLKAHGWPGNVRELRHAIERASILAEEGAVLLPEHFSLSWFDSPVMEIGSLARHTVRDF